MGGRGVKFSGHPWRVQDFDISVVCGIEVKLCHNLPLRGVVIEPVRVSAGSGPLKNLLCGQELAPEDRY
jgi:hypothetical protein